MHRWILVLRWSGFTAVVAILFAIGTRGFRETPLRGRLLGDTSPWVALDEKLQAKVSLDLHHATWAEALAAIRKQTGVVIVDYSQELGLGQQSAKAGAAPEKKIGDMVVAPKGKPVSQISPGDICLNVHDVTLQTALELLLRAASLHTMPAGGWPDLVNGFGAGDEESTSEFRLGSGDDSSSRGAGPSLSGEPLGEEWMSLAAIDQQLAVKPDGAAIEYFAPTNLRDSSTSFPSAFANSSSDAGRVLFGVDWGGRQFANGFRRVATRQPNPFAHLSIPIVNQSTPELKQSLQRPLSLRFQGTRMDVLAEVFRRAKIPWGYLGGYRDDRVVEAIGTATTQQWVRALMTEELGCQVIGSHVLIGARSFTAYDTRAYPLGWTDQIAAVVGALQHLNDSRNQNIGIHGGYVVVVASTDVHWQCDDVLKKFYEVEHGDSPAMAAGIQLSPVEAKVWRTLKKRVTWPAHDLSLERLLERIASTYKIPMIIPAAESLTQRWDSVNDQPLWAAIRQHLFPLNLSAQLRPGGILDATHHSTKWIAPTFIYAPSALLPLPIDARRRKLSELLDAVEESPRGSKSDDGGGAFSPNAELLAATLNTTEMAHMEQVLALMERASHSGDVVSRRRHRAMDDLPSDDSAQAALSTDWVWGDDSAEVRRWRDSLQSAERLFAGTVAGTANELTRRWKIPVRYTASAWSELSRDDMIDQQRIATGPDPLVGEPSPPLRAFLALSARRRSQKFNAHWDRPSHGCCGVRR